MLTIIIRSAVLYLFVIIGLRLMGKRQIGEMQPGELVVTLLISEMAAIPLQDISQPVLLGVSSIATLVFLEVTLSLIILKFPKLHRLISGSSRIIIKNGVLNQKELKSLRISVSDLTELLRDRDVYDITTVAYAIMETNGSLNVLLKSAEQPATKSDLEKKSDDALPLPIISDGIIMKDAMKEIGITRRDVDGILKENKTSAAEVFLLQCDRNLKYTLIKKDENR
ncbi:MAG: DUF421 domain-containing protein [Clostridia bacterium]|nr:DUF421 domain-containing protein [Clostridia bacterium]